MAIQKINDALPNGDTPRKINEKINENFSNTAHAASRLVGERPTDLVENQSARKAVYRTIDGYLSTPEKADFDSFDKGTFYLATSSGNNGPKGLGGFVSVLTMDNYGSGAGLQFAYGYALPGMAIRRQYSGSWSPWVNYYHTENIKKDSNTNLLLESGTSIPSNSAASRIVGESTGNVMQVGAFGFGGTGALRSSNPAQNLETSELLKTQMYNFTDYHRVGYGVGFGWSAGQRTAFIVQDRYANKLHYTAVTNNATAPNTPEREYKTGEFLISGINAFEDGNGFWKTSSPVVRVYANEIDPNDDAQKQGVTYTRNGVGDYTLHNTLGLAQTGWQIELPQDNNRNPLVAIETEYTKDGDLNIRTYRRIFSMETFTFTCDYDNPLDIPEGRCVDVRLHEILPEMSEPEPEEEPIVNESEVSDEDPEVVEEEEVAEEDPVEEDPKD